MAKLTLIRGLPGSGKSTLAKQQAAVHFEADMFFLKNGQYCYKAELITDAHRWCEQQAATALQQGQAVVVSNTFIQWWQIEPYVYLAKKHRATLKLLEARGNYQNIHNVPLETLVEMQKKYAENHEIIAKILEILPASRLCLPQS